MSASLLLRRYWRAATDPQIASILRDARIAVAAFADATARHGSLLLSLTQGRDMIEFNHYPPSDVIDLRNGSQFYYHSHREGNKEHGHLHLFWHATATGNRRYLRADKAHWARTAPTHLFAISLDPRGFPVGLFTVNRWVTDGHWLDAATTSSCVKRFTMREMEGYEHTCRWLMGFVRLYRPLVDALLVKRDRRLAARSNIKQALDDRRLDLLSDVPIDWIADLDILEAEASRRSILRDT